MEATSSANARPESGSAPLLTSGEMATNLGISTGQLLRLARKGRLPRVKIGHRTIRFDPVEVLAAVRATDGPTFPRSP